VISLFVIVLLLVLILTGCPVYIALGFCGLIGFLIVGGFSNIGALPAAMYGQIDSSILLAIPLYILMGEILASGGLASGLYDSLSKWLQRLQGGLAIASVFACAVFGAVCGVSIAGVAAIGPIAVPEMVKRNYDTKLASGSLAAAGALATLIPPSIVFIIYGSITVTSVAQLFIGGILPGIILAVMMATYIWIRVKLNPALAPQVQESVTWSAKFQSTKGVVPVVLLSIFILVALYTGLCTPTELGAVGSVAALCLTRIKNKSFSIKTFLNVLYKATHSTIAVGMIIASSLCFGTFLNLVRVPQKFAEYFLSLDIPTFWVLILFMLFLVLLGCFIDGVSIIVVTTPIFLPVVLKMGFDPIWYGIILAINIEMAVITPPVGLNLYMMKSVLPELKMEDVTVGAFPFVIVEFICMLIFMIFPGLALWLPNLMK
jgi:C4-dicarboxylate transporter, DctM subunit